MFGNPLLDITVSIKNDELLKKYNLEKNGQKELSLEKLNNLIDDAKARYEVPTESRNSKLLAHPVPFYRLNKKRQICCSCMTKSKAIMAYLSVRNENVDLKVVSLKARWLLLWSRQLQNN